MVPLPSHRTTVKFGLWGAWQEMARSEDLVSVCPALSCRLAALCFVFVYRKPNSRQGALCTAATPPSEGSSHPYFLQVLGGQRLPLLPALRSFTILCGHPLRTRPFIKLAANHPPFPGWQLPRCPTSCLLVCDSLESESSPSAHVLCRGDGSSARRKAGL